MRSRLLKALPVAVLLALTACATNNRATSEHIAAISQLEREYYQGCASEPPADPTCGRH